MHDYAQNNKKIYWSRKMIELFIQLYKENEFLYDMSNVDFNNSERKSNAHLNMLRVMQKFSPELELNDISDKIEAIRSQLSTEFSNIDAAAVAGTAYVPKLWCFEQLEFLRKHMTGLATENDITEEETYDDDGNSDDSDVSLFTEINPIKEKFEWDRIILGIFIEQFKKYQLLYDPKHLDYKVRNKRNLARKQLLTDMKKIYCNINLEDICNKIKHLRTQYTRELRKIKMAQHYNKAYTPKLWCFKQLSYLNTTDSLIKSQHESSLQMDDNSMTHQSEGTVSNDNDNQLNNDVCEYEQEQDVIDEDEVGYDEIVFKSENVSTYEISKNTNQLSIDDEHENNDDNDSDQEHSPPTKKLCYDKEDYNNVKKNDFKKVPECSTKTDNSKKSVNNQDKGYEWLGELVVSQLGEISSKYHTDFAWDVQCLMRKYILKTKEDADNTHEHIQQSSSETSTNNQRQTNIPNNIVLPRSSNVSLNISFI